MSPIKNLLMNLHSRIIIYRRDGNKYFPISNIDIAARTTLSLEHIYKEGIRSIYVSFRTGINSIYASPYVLEQPIIVENNYMISSGKRIVYIYSKRYHYNLTSTNIEDVSRDIQNKYFEWRFKTLEIPLKKYFDYVSIYKKEFKNRRT